MMVKDLHPPCVYHGISGMHHKKKPGRTGLYSNGLVSAGKSLHNIKINFGRNKIFRWIFYQQKNVRCVDSNAICDIHDHCVHFMFCAINRSRMAFPSMPTVSPYLCI
jgi:hypothetical protein